MEPDLSFLEELARRAGEILRAGFGRRHQVEYKSLIDPVTEVDRRSEELLLGEIRRRFPTHTLIAEESGESAGKDCCIWYIDPLDGTVNFAHSLPIFSVSIAYAQGDQVKLGVVYDPMREECFAAEHQRGAWLNGERLRVSSVADLDRSLLVTGFPYDIRTNPDNNLQEYRRLALRSQGVRRLGSAALDLCYVAAGRFDGYWELSLSPWDMAAGVLIAREAGALVTNRQGSQEVFTPPYAILAANPELHPHLAAALGAPG